MSSSSIPLKRCSSKDKCAHPDGPWLPATREYFSLNKDGRFGLQSKCRLCRRAKYYENPEPVRERAIAWRKANPEKKRENGRKWREKNKEKIREAKRHEQQQNPEKDRARGKRYRDKNRERVREMARRKYHERVKPSGRARVNDRNRRARELTAEGKHTQQDIEALYRSQKGLCWWCGEALGDKYHVDHRIPLSKGGTNWPSNLCLSCPGCNLGKNNKLPWEWKGRLL